MTKAELPGWSILILCCGISQLLFRKLERFFACCSSECFSIIRRLLILEFIVEWPGRYPRNPWRNRVGPSHTSLTKYFSCSRSFYGVLFRSLVRSVFFKVFITFVHIPCIWFLLLRGFSHCQSWTVDWLFHQIFNLTSKK